MKWIKDNTHDWITPGGDPVWICPACGGGRHVYGIENCNDPQRVCKDCGSKNSYPWESDEDMRCENCKYWHKLKHSFITGDGFTETSCCIALTRLGENIDDYRSFIVETHKNDMCEMFTEK